MDTFRQFEHAVNINDTKTVSIMVQKNPSLLHFRSGKHRATILMTGIAFGASIEMIELLIKLGADIHAVDDDSWNSFHWALQNCEKEHAQLLIDMGIDYAQMPKQLNGHECSPELIKSFNKKISELLYVHVKPAKEGFVLTL